MTGKSFAAKARASLWKMMKPAWLLWTAGLRCTSGFWRTATIAALVAAAVTLRDVGLLLSRFNSSGHSFGPGTFTGFKVDFWDTADLLAAVGSDPEKGVWEQGARLATTLLRTHFAVDLIFAVLLALVLGWMLRAVAGAQPGHSAAEGVGQQPRTRQGRWLAGLPLAYLVVDWTETMTTWVAMGAGWPFVTDDDLGIHPTMALVVHLLSDAKWLVLLASVLAIASMFFKPQVLGRVSWARLRAAARDRSRAEVSVGVPGGVASIVVLFAILIALPGGGPLDQFPDILRVQFDHLRAFIEHPVRNGTEVVPPAISGITLTLFALLVYFTAAASMVPTTVRDVCGGTWTVLVVALGLSLVLFHVRLVVDENGRFDGRAIPTAAPLLVALLLALLAWFIGWVRTLQVGDGAEPFKKEASDTDPSAAPDDVPRSAGLGAFVVGLVVLAAGVGGVRALLPIVLDREGATTPLPAGSQSTPIDSTITMWAVAWICLILSYGVAVLGTALIVNVARGRLIDLATEADVHAGKRRRRMALRWAAYAAFLFATAWLAYDPSRAKALGATGTLTVALGGLVVVFAGLGALTRSVRWARLSVIAGRRTSWGAILVAIWLMAGQLDVAGGYHDARTVDVPAAAKNQHDRSVDQALTQWFTQTSALLTGEAKPVDSGCLRDGRMPMVFVAAPGGGARAMYWTVAGMDRIFAPFNEPPVTPPPGASADDAAADDEDGFCPASLFAASGVSGGAVGLTARLAIAPHGDAIAAADAMATESPLAATIAALLLRDLPQPFTALRSQWPDRAAILETQWRDTAAQAHGTGRSALDPFHSGIEGPDAPTEKVLEEVGAGWWHSAATPVLFLNGTSVTDGCRVVVGTVHGAAGTRRGCLDAPQAHSGDSRDEGILSATNDVLDGLAPATGFGAPQQGAAPDEACGTKSEQTLHATTAALLAARFPYVTPSGALRRCPANHDGQIVTTYVVDGGYLENTGLLTLMQTWQAISDRVQACNELAASARRAVESPVSGSTAGTPEPVTDLSCPTAGRRPVEIEPWVVMLENHYGSAAAPRETQRPRELWVPPSTLFGKRAVTTGTVALEQAAVAAMTGPAGGDVQACNRFIRLSPGSRPGVEAPLGWVLSLASKASLQHGLDESVRDALNGRAFGDLTGRCQ